MAVLGHPSLEIDSQLGPETEGGSDHRHRFMELLIEARKTFTHTGPDFLVSDQGVETRIVEIANNEIAELAFE